MLPQRVCVQQFFIRHAASHLEGACVRRVHRGDGQKQRGVQVCLEAHAKRIRRSSGAQKAAKRLSMIGADLPCVTAHSGHRPCPQQLPAAVTVWSPNRYEWIASALKPNSASCERVFSLLKHFFGEQQDGALSDLIARQIKLVVEFVSLPLTTADRQTDRQIDR